MASSEINHAFDLEKRGKESDVIINLPPEAEQVMRPWGFLDNRTKIMQQILQFLLDERAVEANFKPKLVEIKKTSIIA